MLSTEGLKQEHRVIERVLKSLESSAEKLERGENIPPAIFNKFLDFIRNFADSCHHGKEEKNLFPVLEKHGIPKEGPIGVMLLEHDQGRDFIRNFAEAVKKYASGDEKAKNTIVENARAYIKLLSQHIPKEDNILYPMADKILSPTEHQELLKRFDEVEERIGEQKHHYYEELAENLEKKLGK